jgi:hypothetical protein
VATKPTIRTTILIAFLMVFLLVVV